MPAASGGDRRQQRDRVRAALDRERLEDEAERRGDQQRGAQRLDDPEGDECARGRSERTQRRREREDGEAEREDAATPE